MDTHSDGTHSLHPLVHWIHWWASDVILIYPNLFPWRNKHIYILGGLRVSTFSANFHFCLNYSFKCRFLKPGSLGTSVSTLDWNDFVTHNSSPLRSFCSSLYCSLSVQVGWGVSKWRKQGFRRASGLPLFCSTCSHVCTRTHARTHTHTHTHTDTHTHTHAHTHTHTCWFLWFMGTLHRRNGFYTVQTVCAIALHLPYT